MGKGFFRVLVALPLDSAAGRKKLNGIHRFLCEGHDWDMELVRNSNRFTTDSLNDARDFEGMLIGFAGNPAFKRIHTDLGIPSVFIDYPDGRLMKRFPLCTFINDDTADIAKHATRHLLACPGIKSFGFVPTRTPSRWSDDRCHALKTALRAKGIHLSQYSEFGRTGESLEEWLTKLEKPAAVLVAFDDLAHDVLKTCRSCAIEVPNQVSVLGIGNDEPICETAIPPLTSIAVDFEQEGYRAARDLQTMMLRPLVPAVRISLCGVREVVFRASTTASKAPEALAQRALAFIDRHALEGISSADVIAHLRVSKSLADLRFREVTGTSLLQAILDRRLKEVKRLLRETDLRITEIAIRCGYRDANYLKNLFKNTFGISMRTYRKTNC